MLTAKKITTLFLDIGDVLLSNGWGHEFRHRAARHFKLDPNEMDGLHHLCFATYEEGKLTLEEYLKWIVFYKERDFTPVEFRDFMFAQTVAFPDMIELVKALKEKYRLKIVVVGNEARELNEFRIKKFQLNGFVDFFISSCYVHLRKPDADIFRMALDIAQVPADEVIFIEDTQLFVDVAADLGIGGILHQNYLSTSKALAAMGLTIEKNK